MNINYNLTDKEKNELQNELYSFFESGLKFEKFIKNFLVYIGLDEIELTSYTRDGGIDCIAYRKGIGEFSDIDKIRYLVQVKRYKINNKVSVDDIRKLKGVKDFNAGDKGIFITTSDYTKGAIVESTNDENRPVILINGTDLVNYCIDKNIGFVFKPIFSIELMKEFMEETNECINLEKKSDTASDNDESIVEKVITSNDVRAKIISIPSSIYNSYLYNKEKVNVIVNDDEKNIYYNIKINHSRKYLSGITKILRKYQILSSNGTYNQKMVSWKYNTENAVLMLYINI